MSGCDCKKTSRRDFARPEPGPPPRVIAAEVRIDSQCREVELPGGGDGGGEDFALAALSRVQEPEPKTQRNKKGRRRTICANFLTVTLTAGSTDGLRVVELQAGGDTFALDVGVGASQTVTRTCSACEVGTASVRIVDAAGVIQAVLGNFAICQCVP